MVKGITRQVVVVQSPDPKLFDQAIFLVRENALEEGGITEEALLSEARTVCKQAHAPSARLNRFLWAAGGSAVTGLFWLLSCLF